MLRLPENEAVEYLFTRHAAIFKLYIKAADELPNSTKDDGSCGFRAIGQASQRVGNHIRKFWYASSHQL